MRVAAIRSRPTCLGGRPTRSVSGADCRHLPHPAYGVFADRAVLGLSVQCRTRLGAPERLGALPEPMRLPIPWPPHPDLPARRAFLERRRLRQPPVLCAWGFPSVRRGFWRHPPPCLRKTARLKEPSPSVLGMPQAERRTCGISCQRACLCWEAHCNAVFFTWGPFFACAAFAAPAPKGIRF